MDKLIRRLRYWMRQRQVEAELAEELEMHRSLRQEQLEQAGLSRSDAEFASRRALGNSLLAREDARGVWIWPWLESVWQDASYAVRNLRRQPGFSAVAILTLGCAIGINVSLFTAFNAVAFRPWPVKDPASVVKIDDGQRGGFAIAEYRYLAEHAKSMNGLIAMRGCDSVKLGGERINGCSHVSDNYFRVLGVELARGRGFLAEEDRPEAPAPVAVVSHSLWQNRLGGDPGGVGKRVQLDDVLFTIVGVASRGFAGTDPNTTDVWIPLSAMLLLRPNEPGSRTFLTSPDHCCSGLAGRLAPGVGREQARAELALLSRQFRSEFGLENRALRLSGTAFLANPGGKQQRMVGVFGLMFLGVTLVLLLACANVGNLLLARAGARRQEIAVRLSLGAGRGRLVRQLLTESLVLAGVAASVGLGIAYALPSYVVARLASSAALRLDPDTRVLAYALVIAVVACVGFGLAPALHGTRDAISALKTQRGGVGLRFSLRGFLLSLQIAISVVLLVCAGLLVRGVQRARAQDPGFAVLGVDVVSFELPVNAYDAPRTAAFFRALVAAVEELPGGKAFGLATRAPLSNSRNFTSFRLPGEDPKQGRTVLANGVSRGYFETLGIPLIAGRHFEATDATSGVLVNQALARRHWPDESAVGKTILASKPREILGVVKDAYTSDLAEVEPTLYFPLDGGAVPQLLTRRGGGVAPSQVAAIAARLEPRVEVRTAPLAESLDRWLAGSRVGATLAGALGILALTLAAVGIFGVFGYVVQQRTPEIGIRMALGARPKQIIGIVLQSSGRSLAFGLGIGILGALAASRLLVRHLYGLSPFDPLAYAGVAVVLASAALAATYVPARRAVRVDPMSALRCD